MEFEIGDRVYLKVSQTKGVIRFEWNGKLSPRFVGLLKNLETIGEVAHRLALLPQLEKVHNVFHVSMLWKYEPNASHLLKFEYLSIRDMTYKEVAVQILNMEEKVLRNKVVPLVKVQWQNHTTKEATWELEGKVRAKYPHLFCIGMYLIHNFGTSFLLTRV